MSRLLGLRVDVDTHEGMRDGVPVLLEVFAAAGVGASFFFSMGPDNSGRAIFNVLRPGFLNKMRRTGAARVYGWRTILSGTLLPARLIGCAFAGLIRRALHLGHEAGVHAWDHRSWQDRLLRMPVDRVRSELDRGRESFESATGRPPACFAAPAWLTRDEAVLHQERFGLRYATDCRGVEPFLPVVGGRTLSTPQVPATLPTLDEALGDTCADAASYYSAMLDAAAAGTWPVLTLHAELEGGLYRDDFSTFLGAAATRGIRCAPLGDLLEARRSAGSLPACAIVHAPVAGRHGVVSLQQER